MLAKKGKTGRLVTVPDGFHPGSEVANSSIMGYDQNEVYEGRGPLEAASIGYEMSPNDFALRCNIINVNDGIIVTHNGGNLETEAADVLIKYLNEKLASQYPGIVKFITGIQYRHLLIIKGGNKYVDCAPPHDHPNEEWKPLLVKPMEGVDAALLAGNSDKTPAEDVAENGGSLSDEYRMSAQQTADLLNELILKSQEILENHPFNVARKERGERMANIIEGATGLANTNYEGKAAAAIQALKDGDDFVYVHVEASDEAGHDGDLELKLKTIENLDQRLIKPIFDEVSTWDEPVCIAVLPDHPTPVEIRTHVKEPVPFIIYYPGIEPDSVEKYDEESCVSGSYGLLQLQDFMNAFMAIN